MVPQPQPRQEFPEGELDSLAGRVLKPFLDWLKSSDFLKFISDVVEWAFSRLLGLIVGVMGWVAARLATIIAESEEISQPAFDQLTRVAIKDLLGVDVQIGGVGRPGQRGHHGPVVRTMGEAVLKGLFGEHTGATPGEIRPSDAGAMKFLTTVIQIAFEGWLQGWTAEMFSAGQLETFSELDDTLMQALGLGRLSRRVLGPPMDIFVTTPYTWLLNRTYRPNLLGSAELIRQYIRGRCTRERLFYELSLAGFKDDDIEALLATHQRFLGDEDLVYLVDHGTWTEDQAIQHLKDQGMTEPIARASLALARDRKIDAYRRKVVDAACDAFVAREIDETQLRASLDTIFLPEWEKMWLRKLAGARQVFNTRNLSLSDVEQAVKRGILSIADFRAHCLKMGYSLEDARTLELLLLTEIRDKQAADAEKARLKAEKEAERQRRLAEQAERRARIAAELAVREVSLGQMEALVWRGIRSIEQYREFLRQLKYAPEDVSALAELLEEKIADARADAERRARLAEEAARRRVSLGDLERAVKLELMSIDEYRSQLAAAGFPPEDRELLVRILQRELDQAAQAAAARDEARRRLAERRVPLEDLERAVRLGLQTVEQYRARLVAEGFIADQADLLVQLLRADLAADQEARDRRAEIDARLRRKKISLADVEGAVRAGLRTIADYRSLLLREGYSEEDAGLLVRLLELQIEADRAAAATRAAAEARLAERRVSLGDLERAVKLEVISMADYKAALKREGFSAEDQAVLVALLTAEIAEIREAQKRRAQAEAEAKRRQITLTDLERAVRAGLRTLQEYQGVLAQLGFSAQDQATLVALLQLELDQDRAARARRAQAEAELAQRGLSLSQWERAVVEGVRSLAEYAAWLAAQGYSREDAATLVALLQLELAARAQRESPPPPGP